MWKVITESEINGYFITATWGPRAETPDEIATRFLRMIDALAPIDPVFRDWLYGRQSTLDAHRAGFAKDIEKSIGCDDFGAVELNAGYWFGVRSPDSQSPDRRFVVNCHAGSGLHRPFSNEIVFEESATVQPAPELHNHRIFHAALLAIVDAWEPTTVEANCLWLVQRKKSDLPFRPAWMRYLCPALAKQAAPPTSAIVEYLPDSGLLLSATDQTFDIDNPQHVVAAEEIATALAPLGPSLKSLSV